MKSDTFLEKKSRLSRGLRLGAFVLLAVLVVSLGLMLSNVTMSVLGGESPGPGPTKDVLRMMSH